MKDILGKIKMKNKKTTILAIAGAILLFVGQEALFSATVNVGAVGNSSATGQYLSVTGTTVTTGLIKVGFFSGKSFADIQTVINGWNSSTTQKSAYDSLNNLFTQIGAVINPSSSGGTLGGTTTGLYSTPGSGWNFSSAGAVSGTANYVDLALAPQGTQIYVWAFNNTDFTFSGSNAPTQWALVTDRDNTTTGQTGTWVLPGSGALSCVVNNITTSSDVLLGTDNGVNINMVAVIPEPATMNLLILGGMTILASRRKRAQ